MTSVYTHQTPPNLARPSPRLGSASREKWFDSKGRLAMQIAKGRPVESRHLRAIVGFEVLAKKNSLGVKVRTLTRYLVPPQGFEPRTNRL
jgi:hypothetical protein